MIVRILTWLIVIMLIILAFFCGIEIGLNTEPLIYHPVTPSDYLNDSQIHIYEDQVCIDIANASFSNYAATGSMVPVLNQNANGIRIVPKNESEIHIGDLITYSLRTCNDTKDYGIGVELQNDSNITKVQICDDEFIIHRIVKIGNDSEGVYFIPKGDANYIPDNKIRFSDIRYKTVILIY